MREGLSTHVQDVPKDHLSIGVTSENLLPVAKDAILPDAGATWGRLCRSKKCDQVTPKESNYFIRYLP